jgi:hypothetical protein
MAPEASMYIVSRSVEEDKADLVTVHEVFVVESCPATCPRASRPVSIPRGIQVFTNAPIGTSGSPDSAACCRASPGSCPVDKAPTG